MVATQYPVVSPGDTAGVKVSSTQPNLKYQLVRLLQGLDMPHAPTPSKEIIEHGPKGELKGRFQASHPGSYAIVDSWAKEPVLSKSDGVEIDFYAQPWMLKSPHPQAIISNLDIGTEKGIETKKITSSACRERWFHLRLIIQGQDLEIHLSHLATGNEITPGPCTIQNTLASVASLDSGSPLYFAATLAASPASASKFPVHFFNGRIDSPTFRALGRKSLDIARYGFSVGIDTDEIFDASGSGHDGVLINAPTCAVRGHDYDHKLIGVGWKEATYGFGAIHFHDDDLDDAAWNTDFEFTVPADLRSGA